MHRSPGLSGVLEGGLQTWTLEERTGFDRLGDSLKFLVDDSSGTDVLVSDL